MSYDPTDPPPGPRSPAYARWLAERLRRDYPAWLGPATGLVVEALREWAATREGGQPSPRRESPPR